VKSLILAARMESNGQRNCIHLSQATADLLTEAGKGHWIYPRADLVNAKGKGSMQTYWVNLGGKIKLPHTRQDSALSTSDSMRNSNRRDKANQFIEQQKTEAMFGMSTCSGFSFVED
jgi:Adenylate and Guanylate cyclase catalytic domain